MPSKIARYH